MQASPHVQGVNDLILDLLLANLPANLTTKTLFLRTAKIAPCSGCRKCQSPPHICPLDDNNDDAQKLLLSIQEAKHLIFLAPIYFYHLPAKAKALIDRAQRFWVNPSETQKQPKKPSLVILTAARTKGQFLFQGALLTLKYFLQCLGREITNSYLLPGLDTRDDLLAQPKTLATLQNLLTKELARS